MYGSQRTKNHVRNYPSNEELFQELVLSKTRLAVECSKEILRLTDMVKVLREDTKAMKAALSSGDPLPISSLSTTVRRPHSPSAPPQPEVSKSKKIGNIRKADIFVRRMHGSMQFERPDLSEVLLGQIIDDSEKKSAQVVTGAQPSNQKNWTSGEYQVETEIKDKRGEGTKAEYQVRKRIIYSRWQTQTDLQKDNLHDFAKIYDFKLRDSKLDLKKETLEKERQIFPPDDIASDEDWDVSSSDKIETSGKKSPKHGDVCDSDLAGVGR